MALLEVSYLSNALRRTIPLRVVTPADKAVGSGYANPEGKKYKLMVLLHGLFGSFVDWTNATRIQKWAETNNFMVVMPSGDNSFYVDSMAPNNDYGTLIGEELPSMMRRMFPVSERREDTFIAGLSMGGFGALRNGLKYHETYGYICAFSSALNGMECEPGDPLQNLIGEDKVLGDLEVAKASDKNPRVCAQMLADARDAGQDVHLPKIYMSCGLSDELIRVNRPFVEYLRGLGFDVTWYEGPGEHAWTFWGPEMEKVIANFLPLDEASEGIDSGHVEE